MTNTCIAVRLKGSICTIIQTPQRGSYRGLYWESYRTYRGDSGTSDYGSYGFRVVWGSAGLRAGCETTALRLIFQLFMYIVCYHKSRTARADGRISVVCKKSCKTV